MPITCTLQFLFTPRRLSQLRRSTLTLLLEAYKNVGLVRFIAPSVSHGELTRRPGAHVKLETPNAATPSISLHGRSPDRACITSAW